MRSSNKIQRSTHSGIGKSLTLTDTVVGWHGLPETSWFTTIFWSFPLNHLNPLSILRFGACCWYERRILLMEFCYDLFICNGRKYETFCEGTFIEKNLLEYLCIKWVSEKNIRSFAIIKLKQEQIMIYPAEILNSVLLFIAHESLWR